MINGTYRLIYIEWDNEYLPIGCLTKDSFSENIEMLDTTTRDNNGWKTSTPTNQSYNISFDGLVINTNYVKGDDAKISLDRLRILKRSKTLLNWRLFDIEKFSMESGKAYINEISDSANIDEFISFNCNMIGYGQPITTVFTKKYVLSNGMNKIIQDGNTNKITNS